MIFKGENLLIHQEIIFSVSEFCKQLVGWNSKPLAVNCYIYQRLAWDRSSVTLIIHAWSVAVKGCCTDLYILHDTPWWIVCGQCVYHSVYSIYLISVNESHNLSPHLYDDNVLSKRIQELSLERAKPSPFVSLPPISLTSLPFVSIHPFQYPSSFLVLSLSLPYPLPPFPHPLLPFPIFVARVSVTALKLPQWAQTELGCQTFSAAFWAENLILVCTQRRCVDG